jgi:hypothetical protein
MGRERIIDESRLSVSALRWAKSIAGITARPADITGIRKACAIVSAVNQRQSLYQAAQGLVLLAS